MHQFKYSYPLEDIIYDPPELEPEIFAYFEPEAMNFTRMTIRENSYEDTKRATLLVNQTITPRNYTIDDMNIVDVDCFSAGTEQKHRFNYYLKRIFEIVLNNAVSTTK